MDDIQFISTLDDLNNILNLPNNNIKDGTVVKVLENNSYYMYDASSNEWMNYIEDSF